MEVSDLRPLESLAVDAHFFWEPATAVSAQPPTLTPADVSGVCGASAAQFLGRGSFGETWKVTDHAGDIQAIKIVLDPNYPQELLQREVAGLRRVSSPRVVALHDVVLLPLPGGSRPALRFEFVTGGDVSGCLRSGGWPSADQVHVLIREVLVGVAALHAHETLHRDIKPENIALRGGDWASPVLLDLGLAKLLSGESLTQYPALMGTVPFMAPEQVRQEPARKTADVFAVGVVAFTLLARQHPFYDGRSAPVLSAEALQRMQAGPRSLPVGVPADVADVILRLLAFEPHARGSAARACRELGGAP